MHGFGPPRMYRPTDGLEKPKSLKDIPAYLFKRAKGFLVRLFYIIGLVWQTAPVILILMALFCLADGLLPVAGAYISSELINEIAALIGSAGAGSVADNIFLIIPYPWPFYNGKTQKNPMKALNLLDGDPFS